MIAASASEMVPQGLSMEHETGSPGADGLPRAAPAWPTQQLSSSEQLLFDSLQEHDPTLTSAAQRAVSYPRPIAMNPNSQAKGFVNDFGNATKPTKPKVRGRFSAARRKEVQEVRKRGACIRCRMLKKPVRIDIIASLSFAWQETNFFFSVLATAPAAHVLVLRAHDSGNSHVFALALLRSLNSTLQVRYFHSILC